MSDEMLKVCFTGTCPDYTRAELVEMAEEEYEVRDSVTKDLDILVCADPNASSSKLQKAAKYGVKIMSYKDFLLKLEYLDDEEEDEDLYTWRKMIDELESNNCEIDSEKVEKVEKAYGMKAPDILKRFITKCTDDDDNYICNEYQNCFRILTFDEVIDPKGKNKKLKLDFKEMGCVPVADCINADFIVYNYKTGNWIWIEGDGSIMFEGESLREVLGVLDDDCA